MTTFQIDLDNLTAEELAALHVGIRRHISADKSIAIADAGRANCGEEEFDALRKEVRESHDHRMETVEVQL